MIVMPAIELGRLSGFPDLFYIAHFHRNTFPVDPIIPHNTLSENKLKYHSA
jgi:hypothetical protein